MRDVVIIGGGLSGLINARLLSQAGLDVLLIEKKQYPFHRVCGEYVSNETLPFLKSIGFDPFQYGAVQISRFRLSSPKGSIMSLDLDMGAFGLSRYVFDHALYELAQSGNAHFQLGEKVLGVEQGEDSFRIKTAGKGEIAAKVVIGAFGKRSNLDAFLGRRFFRQRSPWVGVKHHLSTEHPEDLIELHNFRDGYCGISKVEEGRVCLCYLTARSQLKKHGNIQRMEDELLSRNPHLKRIFDHSERLYERPQVINEVSFARKPLIENGILMSGDSGGMIAPLCGNGMAMAIHSAKILSEHVIRYFAREIDRPTLEQEYTQAWKKEFARRLWVGRNVQRFFGNPNVTEMFVQTFRRLPGLSRWVVGQTHGDAF